MDESTHRPLKHKKGSQHGVICGAHGPGHGGRGQPVPLHGSLCGRQPVPLHGGGICGLHPLHVGSCGRHLGPLHGTLCGVHCSPIFLQNGFGLMHVPTNPPLQTNGSQHVLSAPLQI